MGDSQREMTLEEWCNNLPDCHLVNREYKAIKQQLSEAQAEIERLKDRFKKRYMFDDEATVIAAQCWCDETTKHLGMIPELAEAFTKRISAWMDTGAFHARNEEYWSNRAKEAEAECERLREFTDKLREENRFVNDMLENAHNRSENLQAKLSRYEQGVEVEGCVRSRGTSYAGFDNYVEVKMPLKWSGKRVKVLVMGGRMSERDLAFAILATIHDDISAYESVINRRRFSAKHREKLRNMAYEALNCLFQFNPALLMWCEVAGISIIDYRRKIADLFPKSVEEYICDAPSAAAA